MSFYSSQMNNLNRNQGNNRNGNTPAMGEEETVFDNDTSNQPAVPLPDSGEGGPVYEGNTSNQPVIPLPNPGEGGPAYNGDTSNRPVTPLPNLGEGGPVYDGNIGNRPVIPLPNPGEGGPVYDGNTSNQPLIPLPNPGEGGPVFQGPIITVPVRPVIPCFFCNSNSFGNVRFLNAATGYASFVVSVGNETAVAGLEYAELSEYGRVSTGYQTITVAAANGYVYISKQIRITLGSKTTVAIVNTQGGLDLVMISDVVCNVAGNNSCIRACNLSYNSGGLNVYTGRNTMIFRNVQFMDVTDYRRILPGTYVFHIASGTKTLVSTEIQVRRNSQYTIYIFNWNFSPDAIRTLVVEDRK